MSRDELLRVFQHKYNYLKVLYSALAVGQSVIFVNSRRLAFFLALKMQNELNFSVSLICGGWCCLALEALSAEAAYFILAKLECE